VKNRYVRLSLPRVEARIGDYGCKILNLSITGALLLLDFAPEVNSVWKIVLQPGTESLELNERIVRVNRVTASGKRDTQPQWTAGVAFVDLSPQIRRAIARFYSLLLEASKKAGT
jgi:hypothetical protein